MKIRKIKKILIGDTLFKVIWDKKSTAGYARFATDKEVAVLRIGTNNKGKLEQRGLGKMNTLTYM